MVKYFILLLKMFIIKKLLKIKSVPNDLKSDYSCIDCEIVDSCISIKLAESCFIDNRHFIKMKICNEL